MPRGPKQHLKRLNAPKHWMLDKMGGIFATMPNAGKHKLRECIPLILLLRNRLKYALTMKETRTILMDRVVEVDGRVRTDPKYPAGFNDTLVIKKTNDYFRLLYDTKGRFVLHPITKKESRFKLCKVTKRGVGASATPFIQTHDARLIRFPDPLIKVNDTVKINLETGKVTKFVPFKVGNLCMITGGHNTGRIGEIIQRERHPGSFEIVHVRDIAGHTFTTRATNVFAIGQGHTSLITLPRGKGLKLSTVEDRKKKLAKQLQDKKGLRQKKKQIKKKAPKKSGKSKTTPKDE
jgi:small subunit ribosomal protein S4e